MLNWILGRPKSFISVASINDMYINTLDEVGRALGEKAKTIYRKRFARRIFVIDFDGDVMASQATGLTLEITSIICNAKVGDEVLIKLTSPGGAAHAYGYAASQIDRLKKANIKTTVAVDKVAASGGYMMACVADRIIAAPFAIIGSVGVVAEFPNFNKLLKNLGIDYKQYTAGEFKRTVSPMGPVTFEGEKKFTEDLNDMYHLFRNHVSTHRPILSDSMDTVATGEHWSGVDAMKLNLVDEIQTSEEFILSNLNTAELIKISYTGDRKTLAQKLGGDMAFAFADGIIKSIFSNLMRLSVNSWLTR